MKTNSKKLGPQPLTNQLLLYDHLASVSYTAYITRPLGPTVVLDSFANIKQKLSLVQIHTIGSILSSSPRALSEITDTHTHTHTQASK